VDSLNNNPRKKDRSSDLSQMKESKGGNRRSGEREPLLSGGHSAKGLDKLARNGHSSGYNLGRGWLPSTHGLKDWLMFPLHLIFLRE